MKRELRHWPILLVWMRCLCSVELLFCSTSWRTLWTTTVQQVLLLHLRFCSCTCPSACLPPTLHVRSLDTGLGMERLMAKSTVHSAVRLVRSLSIEGPHIGLRRFANAFGFCWAYLQKSITAFLTSSGRIQGSAGNAIGYQKDNAGLWAEGVTPG